jgi:PAS domain S-box-containing protein
VETARRGDRRRDEVVVEHALPRDPTSPRLARALVAEALAGAGRDDDLDVAVLLVSELVTNAAVHAEAEALLRVRVRDDVVRVEVVDASVQAPVMRARDTAAESGRGMLLVEELADAWGVDVLPDSAGKAVWFELGAVDDFGRDADGDGALQQAFADLFPRVLADAPSAIILVNLDRGEVTYANARARELAPATALPCPTDAWSAAADLRDPSGEELAETDHPLSRLAGGQPIAGEPVTIADADRSDGRRRLVWLTAFPLSGVSTLRGQALVTFFEMSGSDAAGTGEAADALQAMRERAVIATDISFTITDPRQPDNPLVWVNPAFTRVTGYAFDEVIGTNCRFLQGPATDPESVAAVREAIAADQPITLTLLNYRKDGTAFWNELAISPVFDADGQVIHHVGVQADVTARVQMEQERETAYRSEQRARSEAEEARAEAEQAQERMALLAEATEVLTATLDVDTALERLAALAVPVLADWCTVELSEEAGGRPRRFTSRSDGSDDTWSDGGGGPIDACAPLTAAHAEVLAGGDAVLLGELDGLDCPPPVPRAAVVVPLRARRRMLGVMTLVTTDESGRRYDRAGFELARDLGRRAGMAVDNARLYTREHEVAEELQRSLLPTIPTVPGLGIAARYLAASEHADVGGDWFDVLSLPDGAFGLAVGDVMGHDMRAAAAMSQLRSVLRSYAWEGGSPASVLSRLDQLIQGLEMAQLATATYARLEPGAGDRVLRYTNAGHLPPLLIQPDGEVCLLDEGQSVLLGADTEAHRDEAEVALAPGSTVLLYTDGLVERRGEGLDAGLDRLLAVAARHPAGGDPEALCDLVLAELVGEAERGDDIALLAVTLGEAAG